MICLPELSASLRFGRRCTAFLLLTMMVGRVCNAQSPVPTGATVERLATGFVFVEGPVWSDSLGLLFSDLSGNKIYCWSEAAGAVPFLSPSSNSNGLTYDSRGRLLITQTGLRRVVRQDSGGVLTVLASQYGGKKLNSPNDIIVKSDGGIFFTDPPFNIPTGEKQELSFSGIYRISPSGVLQLLDSTLALPNGICFSPDESKLYVNESQQRVIYVWDVVNDSVIANKRTFATIAPTGYADGMKVDTAGNLFCAGPTGIWVFSPTGAILDTILVPETPSNCNWGGADRGTLFITAQTSLYRIRLAVTEVGERTTLPGEGYQLLQNYPNPFNPTTVISGQWSADSWVKLVVYDVLGREVATLANGRYAAGLHSFIFDARGLASGVYFYRLTAGAFTQTRAMILMR